MLYFTYTIIFKLHVACSCSELEDPKLLGHKLPTDLYEASGSSKVFWVKRLYCITQLGFHLETSERLFPSRALFRVHTDFDLTLV